MWTTANVLLCVYVALCACMGAIIAGNFPSPTRRHTVLDCAAVTIVLLLGFWMLPFFLLGEMIVCLLSVCCCWKDNDVSDDETITTTETSEQKQDEP